MLLHEAEEEEGQEQGRHFQVAKGAGTQALGQGRCDGRNHGMVACVPRGWWRRGQWEKLSSRSAGVS